MKKLLLLAILALSFNTNAQYTKLLDFAGSTNGSHPYGTLIYDGTFFYGMTSNGGTNNLGAIFKIKPDGTGYSKLLDFSGLSTGSYPFGSLISDSTFLYGMTSGGGTNDMGVIFKIKPDGTGYSKLLDFTGTANGSNPNGSLISDGTFIYGMTYNGGTGTCPNGCGVAFKIKLDGTSYAKLLNLSGNTYGDFFSDGTFLYGMEEYGTNGYGNIFKIKPDGTGYTQLLNFASGNGNTPVSSLISDGTFLFGMTYIGGTNNDGTIFKIMPDGTGYTKLLDFTDTARGKNPNGSLTFDGTFLNGMTWRGGTNNLGTIFKIKPDGTGYVKLLDFAGATNGSLPSGSLIYDGTFFYGMTYNGGTNNLGVIFKLGLATSFVEKNTQDGFKIYPNPTNGEFKLIINLPLSTFHSQISIYNILGEVVYKSEIKNQQSSIDLSFQPNGIYFLSITTETKSFIQKLIIQK